MYKMHAHPKPYMGAHPTWRIWLKSERRIAILSIVFVVLAGLLLVASPSDTLAGGVPSCSKLGTVESGPVKISLPKVVRVGQPFTMVVKLTKPPQGNTDFEFYSHVLVHDNMMRTMEGVFPYFTRGTDVALAGDEAGNNHLWWSGRPFTKYVLLRLDSYEGAGNGTGVFEAIRFSVVMRSTVSPVLILSACVRVTP